MRRFSAALSQILRSFHIYCMERTIMVFKSPYELDRYERSRRRAMSPEQRLLELEAIRSEAGKFLYEHSALIRSVITVTRKASN